MPHCSIDLLMTNRQEAGKHQHNWGRKGRAPFLRGRCGAYFFNSHCRRGCNSRIALQSICSRSGNSIYRSGHECRWDPRRSRYSLYFTQRRRNSRFAPDQLSRWKSFAGIFESSEQRTLPAFHMGAHETFVRFLRWIGRGGGMSIVGRGWGARLMR